MRIALAQIQSGTEPTANLGLVEDYTRRAADAGASMVLFPEATMCRFGVPLEPGHLVRGEKPAADEKPVPAVIGELLGGQEARLPERGTHGTRTTFP